MSSAKRNGSDDLYLTAMLDPTATRREAIDLLGQRVAQISRVREHLLWDALRLLPSLQACRERPHLSIRLTALMASEAFFDSVLMMVAEAQPALALQDLHCDGACWTSRILVQDVGLHDRPYSASHPDKAGAVLMALIAVSQALMVSHV